MTKDEALKHALEKFEYMNHVDSIFHGEFDFQINAIKKALAQQAEPWEKFCDSNCVWTDHHPDCKLAERLPLTDEQIYKASTQAGMQEHYMGFHSGFIRFARAIEAAHGITGENMINQIAASFFSPEGPTVNPQYQPSQRTWVGLTDWEINSIAQNNHPLDGIRTFARAIEAKLKEKNT